MRAQWDKDGLSEAPNRLLILDNVLSNSPDIALQNGLGSTSADAFLVLSRELNLYPYVDGNPLSITDPSGEIGGIGNFIRACGIAIGLLTGKHDAIGAGPNQIPKPVPIELPTPPCCRIGKEAK